MTDYAEEKANELDALRAIYPEEFVEEAEDQFRIEIAPDEVPEDVELCRVALWVKYTDTYPDTLPETRVDCIEGELTPTERGRLEQKLKETAEENVGMAVVFTIVSSLKEDLTEIMVARKADISRRKDEALAKEVEAEAAKFHGTKVCAENFLAWKAAFEKEMAQLELVDKAARKAEETKLGRLTGKQLFEQDKSLAQSDAKFVEEGDVTVDASQFERELNIRDEDEEEDEENGVAASLFRNKDD